MYLLFGVLLLGSLSFAMSNATAGTKAERGRWLGLTGSSVVTEGGNITNVNVTGATLTDRWAAFYGNVSGSINLTDSAGVRSVYTWAWNASTGGSVCFSEGGSFGWAGSAATLAAGIDANWSLDGAADNATNTFTNAAGCGLNFTQKFVASSARVNHTGLSTFWTCAIQDAAPASKNNYAFCTNITPNGLNWNGENSNYEIMVPTTPGIGTTETYYVYAELR